MALEKKRRPRGGIVARVGVDGVTRYYGRYVDVDGKRKHRFLSKVSRDDARSVLSVIQSRVVKRNVGMEQPTSEDLARRSITIRELGEKFTAGYTAPKLKDPDQYRKEAKSILKMTVAEHLGDIRAAELTTGRIDLFVEKLTAEKYAGSTIRSALAKLSKMYVWGRKRGHIDCDNPVRGVERPQTRSLLEFLTHEEVDKLLGYIEIERPPLFPMVATVLYAGLRKGECLGLRWQDVHIDGARPRIDVMRSYSKAPKSGKGRTVPLNPELAQILRRWRGDCPKSKAGLVFPVAGAMGSRVDMLGMTEIYALAELRQPEMPWHCLRHTFASHFIMAGGSILALQKLLGHGSLAMTQIYAHLAPDYMDAQIAQMSFRRPLAGTVDITEAQRAKVVAAGHPEDNGANATGGA